MTKAASVALWMVLDAADAVDDDDAAERAGTTLLHVVSFTDVVVDVKLMIFNVACGL